MNRSMKTMIPAIFITLLLAACGGNESQGQEKEVAVPISFDTYCNERYDYCVDYPVFLEPQGESDSRDGQTFVSADGKNILQIFQEYKMDMETGEFYDVAEAYYIDRERKGAMLKELHENHYILGREIDGRLERQVSIKMGQGFLTLLFDFDKNDKDLLDRTVPGILNSVNFLMEESGNSFFMVLGAFLEDCWWDKDFNRILRKETYRLESFLHPNIELRRLYSPGTFARVADSSEGFALTMADETGASAEPSPEYDFSLIDSDISPCMLDNPWEVYYMPVESLPEIVVNNETFETAPLTIGFPESEIICVYLVRRNRSPIGFYFVNSPDLGWKLVLIDNSLCEA